MRRVFWEEAEQVFYMQEGDPWRHQVSPGWEKGCSRCGKWRSGICGLLMEGKTLKATGYSIKTPLNWFDKFGLPWSDTGSKQPKSLGKGKPPKKLTKPNRKIELARKEEKGHGKP